MSNSTDPDLPAKYLSEFDTCKKPFSNYVVGFLSQFDSVPFSVNTIQFILVLMMYLTIGRGKYWKILFYTSIAGLLTTTLERTGVIYTCLESRKYEDNSPIVFFLLEEVFCIMKEYAVPVLNLIKMKAFSDGKISKIVNWIIIILFIPFAISRICIGYTRMTTGLVKTPKSQLYHGYAFAFMSLADLVCSFAILYFVKKHNGQIITSEGVTHYIKRSSYTTILVVDIIGIILSILQIIQGKVESFPDSILSPFRALKYAFPLILAVDALLFKYNVNTSIMNESYVNSKDNTNSIKDNNYRKFNRSFSSFKIPVENNNFNNSQNMNFNNNYNSKSNYDINGHYYESNNTFDKINGKSTPNIYNHNNNSTSSNSTVFNSSPNQKKYSPIFTSLHETNENY